MSELPHIKTEQEINKNMLDNIDDKYEKSQGFLTADLVKTSSIEFEDIYLMLQHVILKFDVDNLHGEELRKFVYDRKGIEWHRATFAKAILTIVGDCKIKQGDMISTPNNIIFVSVEDKEINGQGQIKAQCTKSGSIGMVGANSITQMPITIAGVTSVTNEQPSYDGFEEETDESLRERYYTALRTPATSGNIYHYRQWALEVAGIGKVKIFPLWQGANTVQVLIINDNMQPASQDLINVAQDYIDPKGETGEKWGGGYGMAPIGAYLTVDSATAKEINISVDVDLEQGYSIESIKIDIENKLIEYFKSIAFEKNYASNALVGTSIIGVDGVVDYRNLKINGLEATNIPIGEKEVAVLGNVVVS